MSGMEVAKKACELYRFCLQMGLSEVEARERQSDFYENAINSKADAELRGMA